MNPNELQINDITGTIMWIVFLHIFPNCETVFINYDKRDDYSLAMVSFQLDSSRIPISTV